MSSVGQAIAAAARPAPTPATAWSPTVKGLPALSARILVCHACFHAVLGVSAGLLGVKLATGGE